jgi:hypothetical protein
MEPVAFSSKHEEEYEQNRNNLTVLSTRKIPMNFEESANNFGEVLGVLKDQPGTESNEKNSLTSRPYFVPGIFLRPGSGRIS